MREWAETADWCELAEMTINLEIEKAALLEYLSPEQIKEYDDILFVFEHSKAQILEDRLAEQDFTEKMASKLRNFNPMPPSEPEDY